MTSSNQGQNYTSSNQASHAMNSTTTTQGQSEGQGASSDYYNQQQSTNPSAVQQNGNGNYQQHSSSPTNNQQTTSGKPNGAQQQYPDSKAPDTMHVWLDKIEKKFGGERFDEAKHPENAEKNKKLNENSESVHNDLCLL